MTTSKKLVPLTQPIHITVDNAADFPSGGGGGGADFIDIVPYFLEDYKANLERFTIVLDDDAHSGFHSRGSLGDGNVSFLLPLGPAWSFHLKVRDSSVTTKTLLVFTLYDDADEAIGSKNYPIQWMDFGDGAPQADVTGIRVSEISGVEHALYVAITLVPGAE